MTTLINKALLSFALTSVATSVLANNTGTDFNLSMHTIAGGMGGAAYTKPQEASAAVFGNPATLAQFQGNQYNFGASLLKIKEFKNTQTTTLAGMGPDGSDATFSNSSVSSADNYVIPTFGSINQINDDFYFGYGLEVDAGIGADFRNDPITLLGGAGEALVGKTIALPLTVELISINANFAGAYQVTPELSLGASFTVGFGLAQLGTVGDSTGYDELGNTLEAGLALPFAPLNDFGGTTSSVHDTAFAYSLGATYLLPSGLGFSAAIKSPLAYKFEDIIYADTAISAGAFQDMEIEQPLEAIVGIAFDNVIADGVLIEADAIWKNWSNANSYEDVYDDQLLLTFGVQFSDVLPGLDLRLGYSHAENPLLDTPNNTISGLQGAGSLPLGETAATMGLSPLATDIMKIVQMTLVPVVWQHTFSGGLGYQLTDSISVNAYTAISTGEKDSRSLDTVDGTLGLLGVNSSTTQTVELDPEISYGLGIHVKLP